ncbi:MAG: helix-turn-helix transcriptional regulator [Lachnospiraceae bacterium]|nr:helix-turn-helix transcriptional regulator [Lachnospiraceae bacterium]
MESMGDRIKRIRKEHKLTQEEFAKRIGTNRGNISVYEIDSASPSVGIMTSLCKEFNVNEIWLRTGNGEPYVERSREKRIEDFFKDVELGDNDFKKAFIEGLAKLTTDEWVVLENICRKMAESSISPAAGPDMADASGDTVHDDLDSMSTKELEDIYKNETLPRLSEKEHIMSPILEEGKKAE